MRSVATSIGRISTLSFLLIFVLFHSESSAKILDAEWQPLAVADLNRDGKVDVLWRNASNGWVSAWLLDRSQPTDSADIGRVNSSWQFVGAKDMNNDGFTDIVWRSRENNFVYVWLMNGTKLIDLISVQLLPSDWDVIGIHDINRDGKQDLILRNRSNGWVGAWLLNGTTFVNSLPLGTQPLGLSWQLVGIADFNQDGHLDLAWRNSDNAWVSIWTMNNLTITNSVGVAPGGLDWYAVSVTDMNGDGSPDILWRHRTNGQVVVWRMNRTAVVDTQLLGSALSAWQPIGMGDTDGDRSQELLWVNQEAGFFAVWTMDKMRLLGSDGIALEDPRGFNSCITRSDTRSPLYVSSDGEDRNDGSLERPVRTLVRAQELVRMQKSSSPSEITVCLRGGYHWLSRTLLFGSEDGGTAATRVTYRAYPGESAVISGGRKITGWKLRGDGIYEAYIGSPPFRQPQEFDPPSFRQLYVNGAPAVRARHPNVGEYFRIKGWDIDKQRIFINDEDFRNPVCCEGDVELHLFRQWTASFFTLAGVHPGFVVPSSAARPVLFWLDKSVGSFYTGTETAFLENSRRFIDETNEWYLDRYNRAVLYKPPPGLNMQTAEVIAPQLKTLVSIQGGGWGGVVQNLHFRSIGFEHTTWTPPYLIGGQGDLTVDYGPPSGSVNGFVNNAIPAAVDAFQAKNISFARCTFKNLGTSGLALMSQVASSSVLGNVFHHVGGSGIQVGADLLWKHDYVNAAATISDLTIRNNLIDDVATVFRGATGIFSLLTRNARIEHNEIRNLPYSGISFNWWSKAPDAGGPNFVRYNRVHNVMNLLSDGAAIYTAGDSPGEISDNWLFNVFRSPWAGRNPIVGIYLDAAGNQVLRNNVIGDVSPSVFVNAGSVNTTLINTGTDVLNFSGTAVESMRRSEPGFSPEAVKTKSGLEPGYFDLLDSL